MLAVRRIVNLLPLEKGETISAAIIATKDFPEDEYLMFGTEQGMVKKTSMSLYDRSRRWTYRHQPEGRR